MKTTFLFTVDVESRSRGQPVHDILGELPGQPGYHGVGRMMDLLEGHQVRGTFFLNVYEVAKHGDEVIAEVARSIHSRGHDLELHTHPRPMYPPYGMSQASRAEQIAILEKGIELIEQWTGKRVVAHRAGAFLANGDTLRALGAVGLAVDCSLAAGSRDAIPLVKELGASNLARRVGGVWEIPVTYYEQVRLGPWRSRRILDIESSSLAEIKHVTRQAIRTGLPTVCILMHSFSFTRHGQPDERIVRRLSALLQWLQKQEGVQVDTVEQTSRRLDMNLTTELVSGDAPYTGVWLTWARALQSWNEGWKNFVLAVGGIASVTILIISAVYVWHALITK